MTGRIENSYQHSFKLSGCAIAGSIRSAVSTSVTWTNAAIAGPISRPMPVIITTTTITITTTIAVAGASSIPRPVTIAAIAITSQKEAGIRSYHVTLAGTISISVTTTFTLTLPFTIPSKSQPCSA